MKNKSWHSDNDDHCSCGSCECSSSGDENNNRTMYFNSINSRQTSNLFVKNKYTRWSMNSNRPSLQVTDSNKHLIDEVNDDLMEIYRMIDACYSNIPIFYSSVKHAKLDVDFLLSMNNYLDQLKSNIYKDLIRRETLLRNGKKHARSLISLLRCICQISYEQTIDVSNELNPPKRAALYTMTAIDHILQCHYPQKKPLFNYILNELISMWLHENLRIIQEDFSVIVENGTKKNFFTLCICLFHKLESLCAINWERLQMIQNYRLSHFDQLMKPSSIELEKDKEFLFLFGIPINSQKKRSDIPLTSLYSNRTQNELSHLSEIHQHFREAIAKILQKHSETPNDDLLKEDHQLMIPESHARQMITPISIEISSDTSRKPVDEHETSSWNLVSKTHTQIPHHLPLVSPPRNVFKQQLSIPIEKTSKENTSLTLSSIDEPMPLITAAQETNSPNELVSTSESISQLPQSSSNTSSVITPLKFDHQRTIEPKLNSSIDPQESSSPLTFVSPKQPTSDDHLATSSADHDIVPTGRLTVDSKAILNAEVNSLITFLSKLADSSSFIEPENETSRLEKQLESHLKQTNTNPHSITEQLRTSHPQLSLNTTNPLFLAAFTRALRKELEDAQTLRDVDRGQSNSDLQNVGQISCDINNILKLPKTEPLSKERNTENGDRIDHNSVSIEVTHDPAKCCEKRNSKSIHKQLTTPVLFSESNKEQLTTFSAKERWYWIRSKDSSLSKDCRITADSLLYAPKSFDRNTYSITVDHGEQFS